MTKGKLFRKQKNSASEPSRLKHFIKSDATHFVLGLIIFMFAVYATISIVSFFFTGAADQSKIEGLSLFHWGKISGIQNWTGTRGAILSNTLLNEWFGIPTLFLLLFLAFVGLRLMKARYINLIKQFVLCSVLTLWTSLALSFFFGAFFNESTIYIGGKHGTALSDLMKNNFGKPGTFLIIIIVFIIAMMFISSQTIPFVRKLFNLKPIIPRSTKKGLEVGNTPEKEKDKEKDKHRTDDKPAPVAAPVNTVSTVSTVNTDDFEIVVPNGDELLPKPSAPEPPVVPFAIESSKEEGEGEENLLEKLGPFNPKADLSLYRLPSVDLLQKYSQRDTQVDMVEQNDNKNRIIQTLDKFGIKIKSIKATVGPTVTLYEIIPEDGIRINKIRNLEDDIAMSLAALGIRIIAPMPGKGTIGIEVPNKEPQTVSMHSIIASRKYQESKFELPIALGRTITNEVFMVDLIKMPHLLVAGATGQGKSVGLNAAITSLLYRKHPAELKFVLIDPKMVEFSIYSVIEKHFLAKLPDSEKPIITDFTKVIYTLNSLTKEMDDRYILLEKAGSRNVQEYNEKFINRRLNPMKGHRFMPYIVVIIDEFGDLIMTAGKEIEQPIARIAQKARAVGIHMIIATQRPTTNIITGTIKANFPARLAFRVITAVDSRTILDSTGANQLIGRGDMLFFQGNDMTRIQCAFVDTPEVERISKFIGSQQAYPTAYMLPEYTGDQEDSSLSSTVSLDSLDPLFDDAARLLVIHQQGSTSLIQRKFSIGYNRAGRIVDQLELAGIVGPAQGSKPRDVYFQDEYSLEQKLNSLKRP
ncbi:MAG: DNA translocase FtsK [Candidatus Symbiothrix sp.]|jgi:S-DNA-T family DNA segregation ATPase FtsK/SpoIIIE|nr:DNA translocase FtsK [Candidatus Symbiothrix sp.]